MSSNNSVSVVVPVFNSQNEITSLIRDLKEQTISNFEIIIVDDGSTDDTKEVVEELIQYDSRFQYVHQDNGGVSSARNKGLSKASGKYVTFADADDSVANNYIETLLSTFTDDEYIIGVGKMSSADQDNRCNIPKTCAGNEMHLLIYQFFKGYVCNKIFIKEIIDKNNIKFDTNLSVGEDLKFVFEYLYSSEASGKLKYLAEYEIYSYNRHDNSLTTGDEGFFYKNLSIANQYLLTKIGLEERELRQAVLNNFLFFYFKQKVINKDNPYLIDKQLLRLYLKEYNLKNYKIMCWRLLEKISSYNRRKL